VSNSVNKRHWFFKTLIYAAFILFLAWCIFIFHEDIAKINFSVVWQTRHTLFLATLLSLSNYALRVFRWHLYLKKLACTLPFWYSGLTYLAGFAFTLSPGKLGEIARGRYYQKFGVPLSSTTAVFFVERLIDLLAMLVLALLIFASLSSHNALLLSGVGFILMTLIVLTAAPWKRIADWMSNLTQLSDSLKKAIHHVLNMMLLAKLLLKPDLLTVGFIIGLIAWGAEGIGLMLISTLSQTASMEWTTAVGIYAVAVIAGAFSFLPGGLGGTEAVMIALLIGQEYTMADALLLTFLCRLLTLWLAVVIGWMAIIVLRSVQNLIHAPQ
jgi:uncharacterized protein (TIRG00374 family)